MKDTQLLQIQSQTITYLRFPLIVAVVFIHSYKTEFTVQGVDIGLDTTYPIFDNISYFISQVLARLAVPIFFFTSGYLFFFKLKEWNFNTYLSKLRKRFFSLFIPLMFWGTLALLIYFVAQNNPFTAKLFSGETIPIKDYSFIDILKSSWSRIDPSARDPFLYPFWFIRDLIVIVILSPIVYSIIKYLKVFSILILFLLWFFDIYTVIGLSLSCSFFFSLGAYFSLNKLNFINFSRKIRLITFAYPIIAIIDLLTRNTEYNFAIHNIGIIIGIFFVFNLVSKNIENKTIKVSAFLSSASFFVFATHEPWLMFIRKFAYSAIHPSSEIMYTTLYFIPPIVIICLSLLMYYILNKITPKLLSIITGGR